MARPWRVLYRESRGHLLLGRLRWCAALSYVGALVLAMQTILVGGADASTRFSFALAYMIVSLCAGTATIVAPARRRARSLAAGYVLLLIVIMAEQYVRLSQD